MAEPIVLPEERDDYQQAEAEYGEMFPPTIYDVQSLALHLCEADGLMFATAMRLASEDLGVPLIVMEVAACNSPSP